MARRDGESFEPTLPAPVTPEPAAVGLDATQAAPLTPAPAGATSGLDATQAAPTAAAATPLRGLPVIDPENYQLGHELARGGMGRIRAARDLRLDRPVAVKELLDPTSDLALRFERESLITGRLQHPAIVPVYEAGRFRDGQPFFAMKLVAGESLERVIARKRSLDERLALLPSVIAVCEAIAYAHGQRIIHRDLKPANVLCGGFGETVVIDWGLAKELDAEEAPGPASVQPRAGSTGSGSSSGGGVTVAGSVMGTPSYMAPEQARGEPLDERADVYALGAILYHLLTGRPPHLGKSASDVLISVLAGPPPALASLAAGVPRDLAAIAARAMARDAAQRYPSAAELVQELKRFQTGQLVGSHEYSWGELLRRWMRRNRRPLVVAAVVMAVAAVASGLLVQRIFQERAVASRERRDALAARSQVAAESNAVRLLRARVALERDPTEALAWLKQLSPDAPGWDSAHMIALEAVQRGVALRVLRGHSDAVVGVDITPDGAELVSVGRDETVRRWDVATGTMTMWRDKVGRLDGVRWAGAGAIYTGEDTAIVLGRDGHEILVDATATALSSDRRTLFYANDAGEIRSRELLGGLDRGWCSPAAGQRVVALAPAGDGTVVASATDRGVRALCQGGQLQLLPSGDEVTALAFGPAGVAIGARDLTLHDRDGKLLWRAAAPGVDVLVDLGAAGFALAHGDELGLWQPGSAPTMLRQADRIVTLLPAGERVISTGDTGTLRVWDPARGQVHELRGHRGPARAALAGRWLASASDDRTLRVWDLEGQLASTVVRPAPVPGPRGGTPEAASQAADEDDDDDEAEAPWADVRVAASADGKRIASASGLEVRVGPPEQPGELFTTDAPVNDIALSADGEWLAWAERDGDLGIWNPRKGRHYNTAGESAWRVAFAPDGQTIALSGRGVRVFSLVTLRTRQLGGGGGDTGPLLWSPDGASVLVGDDQGAIERWLVSSGEHEELCEEATPDDAVVDDDAEARNAVVTLALSPDGRSLAVGRQDHSVELCDLASGKARRLGSHETPVTSVAFSPDGAALASAASDVAVRLWPVRGGAPRLLTTRAARVAFSSDGRLLATGGVDELRVWELGSLDSTTLSGPTDARSYQDARVVPVPAPALDDDDEDFWHHDGALLFTPGSATLLWAPPGGQALLRWVDDLPWTARELQARLDQLTHLRAEAR